LEKPHTATGCASFVVVFDAEALSCIGSPKPPLQLAGKLGLCRAVALSCMNEIVGSVERIFCNSVYQHQRRHWHGGWDRVGGFEISFAIFMPAFASFRSGHAALGSVRAKRTVLRN